MKSSNKSIRATICCNTHISKSIIDLQQKVAIFKLRLPQTVALKMSQTIFVRFPLQSYSHCLKQFWHFKNEFQYFEIKLKDRGLILRQNLHNFHIFQTFCPSNILEIESNIKITNFCEKYMLFHQKIEVDNPDQNRY